MAHRHSSPLVYAVECVGDRWSLLVVEALLDAPRRFNELQEAVEGIAPNILSRRLKHLEQVGVLVARPYQERPQRHVYDLTAQGSELAGALRLLAHWGAAGSEGLDGVRHELCGTTAEPRWYCPTCARLLDDEEASENVVL